MKKRPDGTWSDTNIKRFLTLFESSKELKENHRSIYNLAQKRGFLKTRKFRGLKRRGPRFWTNDKIFLAASFSFDSRNLRESFPGAYNTAYRSGLLSECEKYYKKSFAKNKKSNVAKDTKSQEKRELSLSTKQGTTSIDNIINILIRNLSSDKRKPIIIVL